MSIVTHNSIAVHRYVANNSERCLELGPFQGRTAVPRIPFEKGVCGTCARLQECVVVADVHAFPGHIACDAASNRCASCFELDSCS